MFNLDREPLDLSCPQCRFENSIRYRQARLHDVISCCGCKVRTVVQERAASAAAEK